MARGDGGPGKGGKAEGREEHRSVRLLIRGGGRHLLAEQGLPNVLELGEGTMPVNVPPEVVT